MSVILSKVKASVWSATGSDPETVEPDDEFSETLASGDRIVLTYSELDERQALQHVRDAGAGASVLFVGTTRNEFEGKSVQRLEYTAYSSMARKMMEALLERQRGAGDKEVKRMYLAHRLGHVATEQPSILVCVSSAHRKAAFTVCEAILEEVKRSVPIWKKEVYDGAYAGSAEWKANARTHWNEETDRPDIQANDKAQQSVSGAS